MQSESQKCKQKLKVKDISQETFNPFLYAVVVYVFAQIL